MTRSDRPLPNAIAPAAMPNASSGRLAVILALLAVPLAAWQALPLPEWRIPHYLAWHSALETVSVTIAAMIATVALLHAPGDTERQQALGFGFAVVGLLDLIHLLSFTGMPAFLSPNTTHKTIVFWLGARFTVAITLLALLWPWLARRFALPAILWCAVVIAAGFNIVLHPAFYFKGRLTPTKIALEWGAMLAYFALGAYFWRRRPDLDIDARLLAQGLLVLGAGELFFTLYREVSGAANLIGHLYKLAGEAWFFRAIVIARFSRPYELLARESAAHKADALRYKTLFEGAPEGVLVVDRQGRIVAANAGAHRLFAAAPGTLVGVPHADLLPPETRERHTALLAGYFAAPRVRSMAEGRDLQAQRFDGSRFYADVALAPIEIDGVIHALAFLRDASERVTDQQRLRFLAHYDPLTGLPKRSLLIETLSQRLAEGKRGAVACFDLDGLARINHVFGHAVGDRLIQEAAKRLREAIGPEEFLARLEGDEFVLLLESESVEIRLQTLIDLLSMGFALPPSLTLSISASAGYVRHPEDGIAAELLLQYAELAMFQAKRSFRHGVALFDHAAPAKSARFLAIAGRLHEALAAHEFRIVLQPRVCVNGEIGGFEALLRWQSKEGEISPADFIPVAEETGFIAELGAFALEEACRVAADWHAKELGFGNIAVNLAPRQIASPTLLAEIIQVLRRHGTPTAAIEFEVTESTAMDEEHWIIGRLWELAAAGFKIALDDFGTGHSSLARLSMLPVRTLKVDIAFVRRIGTREGESVILAILALARSLGLTTVAEGVETAEQKAWLLAQGCDQIQGYLESPPLEISAAEAWLRSQTGADQPSLLGNAQE